MANITPKTYVGYGNETDPNTGNVISVGTKEIVRGTATDANTYVDPEEVKGACEELKEAMNGSSGGITRIKNQLKNVSVDADGHMLQIEDATMEPLISATADSLDETSSAIEDLVTDIIDYAQKEHDNKQEEYNENKKNEISGTYGVTSVVEL